MLWEMILFQHYICGTYPVRMNVSSVRYTLRWLTPIVSLYFSGIIHRSKPLSAGVWNNAMSTCLGNSINKGSNIVLEFFSCPLEPRVWSSKIETFKSLPLLLEFNRLCLMAPTYSQSQVGYKILQWFIFLVISKYSNFTNSSSNFPVPKYRDAIAILLFAREMFI